VISRIRSSGTSEQIGSGKNRAVILRFFRRINACRRSSRSLSSPAPQDGTRGFQKGRLFERKKRIADRKLRSGPF
jgi:hypothetical protein